MRCGTFDLIDDAPYILEKAYEDFIKDRIDEPSALLSYFVRQRTDRDSSTPRVSGEWLNYILDNKCLPGPKEQSDNLVLWLGKTYQNDPADWVEASDEQLLSIIGAKRQDGADYIAEQLSKLGLLDLESSRTKIVRYRLSLDGWLRYQELLRDAPDSKCYWYPQSAGRAVWPTGMHLGG